MFEDIFKRRKNGFYDNPVAQQILQVINNYGEVYVEVGKERAKVNETSFFYSEMGYQNLSVSQRSQLLGWLFNNMKMKASHKVVIENEMIGGDSYNSVGRIIPKHADVGKDQTPLKKW